MRCNTWVRREKKKGSPYNRVYPDFFRDLQQSGEAWGEMQTGAWASRANAKHQKKVEELLAEHEAGGYSRCGGKIICYIEPEEEPYYGGVSCRVEIRYQCDTCKNDYYPALPTDQDVVAEWVTERIEGMPEPERVNPS